MKKQKKSFFSPPVASAVYNLYAVSNHSGSQWGGHYTAYCRNPALGEWYSFNDSRYIQDLYVFIQHETQISTHLFGINNRILDVLAVKLDPFALCKGVSVHRYVLLIVH